MCPVRHHPMSYMFCAFENMAPTTDCMALEYFSPPSLQAPSLSLSFPPPPPIPSSLLPPFLPPPSPSLPSSVGSSSFPLPLSQYKKHVRAGRHVVQAHSMHSINPAPAAVCLLIQHFIPAFYSMAYCLSCSFLQYVAVRHLPAGWPILFSNSKSPCDLAYPYNMKTLSIQYENGIPGGNSHHNIQYDVFEHILYVLRGGWGYSILMVLA